MLKSALAQKGGATAGTKVGRCLLKPMLKAPGYSSSN